MILPLILSPLEKNTKAHWNQSDQTLNVNVRKVFSDFDQSLFQDCIVSYQEHETKVKESLAKRQMTWNRLDALAASKTKPIVISMFASPVTMTTTTAVK